MGAAIFWLIVAIFFVAIDILTSAFIFCWFGIGALVSIVLSLINVKFAVQFIVFTVVSLIAIAIGYPLTKNAVKKSVKHTPLMEETYIGKVFIAEEDIEETGRVKVGGNYWTAENVGKKILKGQKFQVTGIDGNKLTIKLLREE
ncbi:MAG: NfeD family protein [Clostridium sp.]|jgi:hypothetical protein|nr:NfeD family protein [Clostridium sp.]